MKVYCKKLEVGAFFDIPMDWEVKSFHCSGRYFSPVEKKLTTGFRLVDNGFFTLYRDGHLEQPTSLQQACDLIYECGIFSESGADKFFLLFYYNFDSFCLLTSSENYLENDEGCEVIEVIDG